MSDLPPVCRRPDFGQLSEYQTLQHVQPDGLEHREHSVCPSLDFIKKILSEIQTGIILDCERLDFGVSLYIVWTFTVNSGEFKTNFSFELQKTIQILHISCTYFVKKTLSFILLSVNKNIF